MSPKLLYVKAVVIIVIPSFPTVAVEIDVAGRKRLPVILISEVVTVGLSVDDIIGGGSGDRVKGMSGTENGVFVTRFLSAVEAR